MARNQFKDDFDIDNKEALNSRISKNINHIRKERRNFSDRLADLVVGFMGRWGFIFGFIGFVALWEGYNIISKKPFDPYPFILLTGYLSVFVIPQGSIILMSQARQDEKDRLRDDMDYRINAKNEVLIEEILKRLDRMEHKIDTAIMELHNAKEREAE